MMLGSVDDETHARMRSAEERNAEGSLAAAEAPRLEAAAAASRASEEARKAQLARRERSEMAEARTRSQQDIADEYEGDRAVLMEELRRNGARKGVLGSIELGLII